jgi:hypothetical protein
MYIKPLHDGSGACRAWFLGTICLELLTSKADIPAVILLSVVAMIDSHGDLAYDAVG